eukprot:TRINITY_DN4695_c0_g1_i1.p1 TRINITY_DN4695_c0_g1~~TRINITY_DN4695_c0_g1_i1.p1  ORF type:complete len:317 (+),score=55.57 TRINITY_DN4695_c0_g1_i1:151-1101(+)
MCIRDSGWCCDQLELNSSIKPHPQVDIRAAFKRLALKFHPDRVAPGKQRDDHEERFKAVANAYELLLDSSFDAPTTSTNTSSETPRKESNSGANPLSEWYYSGGRAMRNPFEMFEEEFGDVSSDAALSQVLFDVRWATIPRAPPVVVELAVTLEELYCGAKKQVCMPDGSSRQLRIQPGVPAGTALTLSAQGSNGQRARDGTFVLTQTEHPEFERCGDHLVYLWSEIPVSVVMLDGRAIEVLLDASGCAIVDGEGMPILHGEGVKGNLFVEPREKPVRAAQVEVREHGDVSCPICCESVPSHNLHLHLVHCKRNHQ